MKKITTGKCAKMILHNMEVSEGLKEIRKTFLEKKQETKGKAEAFADVKAQPIVCSVCKKIVNMMTSTNENLSKTHIHMKQCLNEFNTIDMLIKKVTNDVNDIPEWLSQHDHLNF